MVSKRVPASFVGAVVIAVLLAACGGADSTATPAPTATRPAGIPTPAAQATATSAPQATATSGPAATAAPTPTATRPPASAATAVPQATPTSAPQATPTAIPASPTPAGPQPKYGGVMTAHWFADYRNWDSWHAVGGFTIGFTKSLMSNLIQFKPGTFQITDDLASSWQASADGKTHTFSLRKDAFWHDGKPVTSKDVLYTFNRGNDPAFTFNRARVAPIATMETPDDYTFKINLKNVSASFLPGVASTFMLMYPAHVPDMAQWQKAPFGSGPFLLKSDRADVAYEFVKNPKYYRKDAAGRALPYLDGINYQVIVDPQLSFSAFRAGRIDCGCIFSQNWTNINLETLRKVVPNLGEVGAVGGVRALQYNLKRAPFSNAAFRQGFGIGLNKASIAATYEGGGLNFQSGSLLVPPELGGQWGLSKADTNTTPGWFPDLAQNVAAARQKFQESGIDLKTLNIKVLGGGFYTPLIELYASVIQSDLGIKVNLVPLSTPETLVTQQRGDFDISLDADSQVIDDPSDRFMNRVITGAPENFGGYSNARVDQLLTDQDKELDVAKRRQMIQDAEKVLLVEQPLTPLFFIKNMRVWYPYVKNYRSGPLHIQNFDFSEMWLDK